MSSVGAFLDLAYRIAWLPTVQLLTGFHGLAAACGPKLPRHSFSVFEALMVETCGLNEEVQDLGE